MIENSSDPRLVLNMWRMASEVLLSTNISVSTSNATFLVNLNFFVGHVSCVRTLIVILKNIKLRTLWFSHRMRSYGQTTPLDKCEQLDLKHPKAMLQNNNKSPKFPKGGEVFVLWPMDYTFGGERTDSRKIRQNSQGTMVAKPKHSRALNKLHKLCFTFYYYILQRAPK